MDKLGEIISRVERRRKWTAEQKVKILTEVLKPGTRVSAVADRNGIRRSQLYAWKKLPQPPRIDNLFCALELSKNTPISYSMNAPAAVSQAESTTQSASSSSCPTSESSQQTAVASRSKLILSAFKRGA